MSKIDLNYLEEFAPDDPDLLNEWAALFCLSLGDERILEAFLKYKGKTCISEFKSKKKYAKDFAKWFNEKIWPIHLEDQFGRLTIARYLQTQRQPGIPLYSDN